jgi:Cu+-exporting ATPase
MEHEQPGVTPSPSVVDPVCGMTVEPATAREQGLHSTYQGRDYYFCGKGCKLEFDDDPEHYLDSAHVPSM